LRWIRARRKTSISLEDVRRDALGQKLDAEQTATLLEALARSGWVRVFKIASTPRGGRPPRRWHVNPLLMGPAAETAETAPTDPPEGVSAVSAVSARQSLFATDAVNRPKHGEPADDLWPEEFLDRN